MPTETWVCSSAPVRFALALVAFLVVALLCDLALLPSLLRLAGRRTTPA